MGGRQGRIEKRIEAVLSRMSIPSREEVTRLSDRIAALSARIDALTAEQGNKPS
jgi:polyhydroxyalkanoate synthesis regulator phasin